MIVVRTDNLEIRYMTDREHITINDAYENNLQHVSLRIPKYKITVFTGVSGSGKSSLVLDTSQVTQGTERHIPLIRAAVPAQVRPSARGQH